MLGITRLVSSGRGRPLTMCVWSSEIISVWLYPLHPLIREDYPLPLCSFSCPLAVASLLSPFISSLPCLLSWLLQYKPLPDFTVCLVICICWSYHSGSQVLQDPMYPAHKCPLPFFPSVNKSFFFTGNYILMFFGHILLLYFSIFYSLCRLSFPFQMLLKYGLLHEVSSRNSQSFWTTWSCHLYYWVSSIPILGCVGPVGHRWDIFLLCFLDSLLNVHHMCPCSSHQTASPFRKGYYRIWCLRA